MLAGLCLSGAILAACGSASTPSPSTPPSVSVVPAPSIDIEARDAYAAAICPVFGGIVEMDPRLAALRSAGAEGGDVTGQAAEIDAVNADLLVLLTDLEAVPDWAEGRGLRHQLITALHSIRAHLLHVAEDPSANSAAADLAAVPYVASEPMDLAMNDAVEGGLACSEDG
jgi:hypothetical protein